MFVEREQEVSRVLVVEMSLLAVLLAMRGLFQHDLRDKIVVKVRFRVLQHTLLQLLLQVRYEILMIRLSLGKSRSTSALHLLTVTNSFRLRNWRSEGRSWLRGLHWVL